MTKRRLPCRAAASATLTRKKGALIIYIRHEAARKDALPLLLIYR